jgi:S-adenosylmethionine uptake transporter
LSALISISLADASAILQAVPLVVTVAAIVFLGERVGPKRIVATLVGFVGVLIIIKPGGDDFNIYYLVALAAVGFIVLRDISTRKLTSDVSTELVAFLTSLGVMLLGLVGSFFEEWSGVSIGQYSNLFFASVALLVGYLFTVLAFRQGDVGFVAPFIYTYLVWAIILSIVMFAEYPDQYTTVGSIIVVVTGLYSFWIEQKETGTVAI